MSRAARPMGSISQTIVPTPPHPRMLGWVGTTALAMGGSNQMIFLITALFIGQGDILGQGSAAVPLLIVGVLLGWAAAPAWTELVLMWPNRVGGISAACAEAFRPYSPVLSALTGTCYWWGWVPTCGLTALLSAARSSNGTSPGFPWKRSRSPSCCSSRRESVRRQMGCASRYSDRRRLGLAGFPFRFVPIFAGAVDWHQAPTFDLTTPFEGWFGDLTSVMAGLYLIGFAAPAFEAAACHVGETIDPNRTCRAPCWRRPAWPASTSSRCRSSGWACSARSSSARTWPSCSVLPSRRCSAASARPRRSGSSCSTCSTARCSRWPAPRAPCRSSPRTDCCRDFWRCAQATDARGRRPCSPPAWPSSSC